LAQFPRIIEVFTQKIVTKPSKIWVWDPGSGKNLFRIPDPAVKKAPDPGSGTLVSNLASPLNLKSGLDFSILREHHLCPVVQYCWFRNLLFSSLKKKFFIVFY
jgi:hypothetical protein